MFKKKTELHPPRRHPRYDNTARYVIHFEFASIRVSVSDTIRCDTARVSFPREKGKKALKIGIFRKEEENKFRHNGYHSLER